MDSEVETQGVSHMVLPNVFVLVSDETEDDISTNWTESIESSPQRVSLTKKSGAHFQKVGVFSFCESLYLILHLLKKCNQSYRDSNMSSRN